MISQVTCKVKKSYSGTRCPIFSFGCMTAICFPYCSEGRIKVEKGDTMIVTRWERKWGYGDMKLSKGWFVCTHHGRCRTKFSSSNQNVEKGVLIRELS